MPDTPLNPDALEAAADAVIDASFGQELPEAPIDLATAAVSAYLAVAQPVVNSVEANKALLREAMAMGWDAAIKAIQYPDGSPVEIMINQNPYRGSKP